VKHAELFFTNTFVCCSSDISGSGVMKRPAGEGYGADSVLAFFVFSAYSSLNVFLFPLFLLSVF
jgi:hypothetical protein